ncbi:hypothetical protein L1887_54813 [Cichorium endivia]|nr:hypothetical protein L1887_54813 [Cichorium endivia]
MREKHRGREVREPGAEPCGLCRKRKTPRGGGGDARGPQTRPRASAHAAWFISASRATSASSSVPRRFIAAGRDEAEDMSLPFCANWDVGPIGDCCVRCREVGCRRRCDRGGSRQRGRWCCAI